MRLEDLDFADDLALLSHTQQQIQKTTCVAAPYGINYELTAFIGKRIDDNQPTSSTVTIVLRKLTAGPKITHRPLEPIIESIKKSINLPCRNGELFIQASIEKPLYYHDESVCVSIVLDNLCQLPVRKLQVASKFIFILKHYHL
ncbi:unnamed protein product [Schistosoma margrebowiei]|uniref:Uncharacterized protein n=1 Tax=Schistosoma margrebowiei TaxID=48269 RepID=A0A183N047_9TREM|nr:unnamed protein product [Schistosoma margrebowiei]